MDIHALARRLHAALPVALLIAAAAAATRRVGDFDTWWHLASGRWIVENGRVPATDTLSYTVPDHPWINLQWLYDVVLYATYSLGGPDAIVLLATIMFAAAVWILFRNTSAYVGNVAAAVLVLWALFLAEERFLIRPEMFSFVFLGLVLRVLLRLRSDDGARAWLLVPLMAAWVNCHALFIVGVVCIICALGGAWAAKFPLLPSGWREASDIGAQTRRRLSIWGPIAISSTILNPYLLTGMTFPLKLMTRIGGESAVFSSIGEFRDPWSGYFTTMSISAYQGLFMFGVAVVAMAAVVDAVGRRRRAGETAQTPGFDLGAVAMFAALAYLSCLARRNLGIFAFGAPPVLAACLSGMWMRLSPRARGRSEQLQNWVGAALVVVCVGLTAATVTNATYRYDGRAHEFGLGVFEADWPVHAVAFARETQLPGPVYNDLSGGGYLTWDHYDDRGVFMDGRLEVYDTKFYSYYQSAFRERGQWQRQVEKYGAQSVFLFHRWGNRHTLIRMIMADPAWTLVYHDPVAVIFVRRAGNEELVTRALAKFSETSLRTMERLMEPVSAWQYAISRIVELETYARVLTIIGRADLAVVMYQRLLELDPPANQEKRVRFSLGYQLARRGEGGQAIMHLERALEIDPDDENVRKLIEQLGG